MRLIDKQYRQRYLFPARWRWDCTTSCLGETDPQGLQGSAFSDCIKTYKNILFQKSRCYEASLGRGLSNHHPPQSQKLSALWLLFVFPLDFLGLVLCSVDEIAKRNGFVICLMKSPTAPAASVTSGCKSHGVSYHAICSFINHFRDVRKCVYVMFLPSKKNVIISCKSTCCLPNKSTVMFCSS